MIPKAKPVFGFLLSGVSCAQGVVPESHHVHRHRLSGSWAIPGMVHASILYYHSDPVPQAGLHPGEAERRGHPRHPGHLFKIPDRGQCLKMDLGRVLPSQEAVRKHAQVLFPPMKKILAYHQSAEAKFGIQPTPDPPEPKD